jgi:hypothetical protein
MKLYKCDNNKNGNKDTDEVYYDDTNDDDKIKKWKGAC